MKRVNHFKPNVKPTHEMAERQWKWNYLRKVKGTYCMKKNEKTLRKEFVGAGLGIGLFTRRGRNETRV